MYLNTVQCGDCDWIGESEDWESHADEAHAEYGPAL
jgi:hypothetical protein